MFKLPHELILFDLETTDIDPVVGSIVQIGALRINKNFEIEAEYESYVMPFDDHFNKDALRVNGITPEVLKKGKAVDFKTMVVEFELFCRGCKHLGAWAAHFDIPFLEQQYKKVEREFIFSHRQFDMRPIAVWEMAKAGKPIAYRIDMFLQLLGKKFKGDKHGALADIKNATLLLQHFLKK